MRINKDSWLITKPIAHRGLWNDKIIENSLSAYENATKNGFPIEIDLYFTSDGKIVSFHDKTLDRMTGTKGFIYEKTLSEIKDLRLLDTDERIPTFDELAEITENKVPLLIEIKDHPVKNNVEHIIERLKKYKGEFAIQSFNPFYINKVKKLAPEFIRGILGTKTHSQNEKALTRHVVKNMSLNPIIKPDFISYSFEDLPLKKTKSDCPIIAWTVTSETDYANVKNYCDNIIFEKFIP